jgi:N-acetylgalactosamine kinase
MNYQKLIKNFSQVYGTDKDTIVVRVPSRINLMGVHVEHRGGCVNYMSINREAFFVVQKRDDDIVALHDVDEKFGPRDFSIEVELPYGKRGDWMNYIQNVKIQRGDWVNYVKAGVLAIQNKFKDKKIQGMNVLVDSSIPIGAGLSSSSSLVVGSALAVNELNGLNISREELVELCGRGEWYVGTRGGFGDHAAMLFGRKGFVLHTRFFPFRKEFVPFPEDYRVVMCNSLVVAPKSGSAKNKFNEKVASYEIALMLIKKKYPEKAAGFVHLRDVLQEDEIWIYEMLKKLPQSITRKELLKELPGKKGELEVFFSTHDDPPSGYGVRKVCLFGLAECKRGEICIAFLQNGEIEKFGELMYISHDGDRIARFDNRGGRTGWDNTVSDEFLDKLIAARTELHLQPGGYGCSCEELDYLVDLARQVPGVVGAGLTGAGLGGCILVLVKKDSVDYLMDAMVKRYYCARGLPVGCEVCVSAPGAEILTDPPGNPVI